MWASPAWNKISTRRNVPYSSSVLYPTGHQHPSTITRGNYRHGRKIGNLCGILYVNNLYLLPPKIWGKWDTIGLILISLPQETPGDKAQLRCFKRESVYISFTIRSQNIGDTRTLNLGIQPTGRDCFPTVHTSGRENGRIRNAFLVMSILGRRERAYSNTRFQSDSTTTINIYIYILQW